MKLFENVKIYWLYNQYREDGKYYDQLFFETANTICILFEKETKA